MTESQIPKLLAALVEHQKYFGTLSTAEAQWVVFNPKEAIMLFEKAIKEYVKKSMIPDLITQHSKSKEDVKTERFNKFALLVDLGTVTVPDDYVHGKCLAMFKDKEGYRFYHFNPNLIDNNFPSPTRILKPGDKFQVKAYRQISRGPTNSEERLAFLKKQNAVLVGAQGATLVFKQKRDLLPKGKWCVSMDEEDRLWEGSDDSHRVPCLYACIGEGFKFLLGYFKSGWDSDDVLLCFCDLN